MTAQTLEEKNKELVTAFYELAITKKSRPNRLADTSDFPIPSTIPEVPKDGPDGFIQFIEGMFKKHPGLRVIIHKAVADGNVVALHVHLKRDESDPGIAVAEFFRVEDGRIVEH